MGTRSETNSLVQLQLSLSAATTTEIITRTLLTTNVTTVVPWLIMVPEKVRELSFENFVFRPCISRKMAAKPLVLPETFSGEGEWSQWICYFESISAVNEWEDAKKLL